MWVHNELKSELLHSWRWRDGAEWRKNRYDGIRQDEGILSKSCRICILFMSSSLFASLVPFLHILDRWPNYIKKRGALTIIYSTGREKLKYVCWSIKDKEKITQVTRGFCSLKAVVAMVFCEESTIIINTNSHSKLIWILSGSIFRIKMCPQWLYSKDLTLHWHWCFNLEWVKKDEEVITHIYIYIMIEKIVSTKSRGKHLVIPLGSSMIFIYEIFAAASIQWW